MSQFCSNLDKTHDVSQQQQFSIPDTLIIIPKQKNSEPKKKKITSNYSKGKNSSFSQSLLQEMLINIKVRHFHSSVNHQEHLFHITHITSYFRPVNITKFLRTAFLQNISRSSPLQMFLKKGVVRGFANFTGKHLCWSLFLKNLQAGGLQCRKERPQHSCFSVEFAKFLRTPFLTEHLW